MSTIKIGKSAGACVVKDEGIVSWTLQSYRDQRHCELQATAETKEYGGTAHQLVLGAKIATEGGR